MLQCGIIETSTKTGGAVDMKDKAEKSKVKKAVLQEVVVLGNHYCDSGRYLRKYWNKGQC